MPNAAQIRAARNFLGWSQKDLAKVAEITEPSVCGIEKGRINSTNTTYKSVVRALEANGIAFLGEYGITGKESEVKNLYGEEGIQHFYNELYKRIKFKGGIIRIIGADEHQLIEAVGEEYALNHAQRVADLTMEVRYISSFEAKSIQLPYVQYKTLPKDCNISSACYIFDDQVSHILLNQKPSVFTIANSMITDAMRMQFDLVWHSIASPNGK